MSDWIEWNGSGEAPRGMVYVRHRGDGYNYPYPVMANHVFWHQRGRATDIVAYRKVLDPVGSEPESALSYCQRGISRILSYEDGLSREAKELLISCLLACSRGMAT